MTSDVWHGLFRRVFRKWHESIMVVKAERIRLQAMEDRRAIAAVREIQANSAGDFPLLMGTDGTFRDPNTMRSFTLKVVLEQYPELEQLNWIVKTTRALAGVAAPAAKQIAASTESTNVVALASGQTLTTLLQKHNFRPRLHSILIGEYVYDDRVKPLTLDIPKSVHILNVGGSGLGKSTLLEAIAIQLSQVDNVRMAAIDYGSGTFDRLEPRLSWQIADDPGLAVALLLELIRLCNERKAAYKEIGRIRSLDQYNAMAGKNLPFVPVLVDEASALLDSEARAVGIRAKFIELVRMGRKYGVGLILGGTDFKADTLPTQARSHCQARIAFWMERALSQSLLNCGAANEIAGEVGEVVVKKPGVPGVMYGRTPNVIEGDYDNLDLGGQPKQIDPIAESAMLTIDDIDDLSLPDDERVRRIVGAGFSLRQASLRVFSGDGGAAYRKAKAALDE